MKVLGRRMLLDLATEPSQADVGIATALAGGGRDRFRAITAPVTLVWGDKDWATVRDRAGVEAALPAPEVITLERTGHFSTLERPQAWADIILARTAETKVSAIR